MIDTEKDIMDVENLDHVVVNEEGREVVELEIEEFNALSEALRLYQKENSLLEVHVSQLQDRINQLEDELAITKIKYSSSNRNRMIIKEKHSVHN